MRFQKFACGPLLLVDNESVSKERNSKKHAGAGSLIKTKVCDKLEYYQNALTKFILIPRLKKLGLHIETVYIGI